MTLLTRTRTIKHVSHCKTHAIAEENRDRSEETIVISGAKRGLHGLDD